MTDAEIVLDIEKANGEVWSYEIEKEYGEDIDRIIKYKISPINISVHTTSPELRVKMLKNRFAGAIMERLKKLRDAEIEIHAQIVLILLGYLMNFI